MSGPKFDSVSLERYRAMQLAAERDRNTALLRAVLSSLHHSCEDLECRCFDLRSHSSDFKKEIESLEKRYSDVASSLAVSGYPSDLAAAKLFNDKLEGKLRDVSAKFQQEIHQVGEQIRSILESQDARAFVRELEAAPQGDYACFTAEYVTYLLQKERERKLQDIGLVAMPNESFLEDVSQLMRSIQLLVLSDAIDAKRKRMLTASAKKLLEALRGFDADRNSAADLSGCIDVTRSVVSEMMNHKEIMEEVYLDCLIEQKKTNALTGKEVMLPFLRSFAEEQEVEHKLEELKMAHACAAENAYIAKALEDVMACQGYSSFRSVCLTENDPMTHRRLFLSDQSDLGIHSFMAPDGTVVFEIASVDDSVRDAEEDALVERRLAQGSYDKRRLLQQQISFCQLHPHLLDALASYGVVTCACRDTEPAEYNSVVFHAVGSSRASEAEQDRARRKSRGRQSEREREMR